MHGGVQPRHKVAQASPVVRDHKYNLLFDSLQWHLRLFKRQQEVMQIDRAHKSRKRGSIRIHILSRQQQLHFRHAQRRISNCDAC
jgi:hypothetical protein